VADAAADLAMVVRPVLRRAVDPRDLGSVVVAVMAVVTVPAAPAALLAHDEVGPAAVANPNPAAVLVAAPRIVLVAAGLAHLLFRLHHSRSVGLAARRLVARRLASNRLLVVIPRLAVAVAIQNHRDGERGQQPPLIHRRPPLAKRRAGFPRRQRTSN